MLLGIRPAKGVHVLGDVLRRRREERQLTRVELGDLSGVTARTIQRAEAGGPVTPQVVRETCRVLGLDLPEVLRPSFAETLERLLACGHAPSTPPVDWVPRDAEAAVVLAHLGCDENLQVDAGCARPLDTRICAIAGAPGIGKTALAKYAVSLMAPNFPDGIAWLEGSHLSTPARVAEAQREIGAALGFAALLPGPDASARDLAQAFCHFFWSRRRLLVIDDVRSPACLDTFAKPAQPSALLFTTHSRRIAERAGTCIVELAPVPCAVARATLLRYVQASRLADDEAGTHSLLTLIAGTPGGIHVTGRLLDREPFTRPSDLVRRVSDPNLELRLKRAQSHGLVAWERSLFERYVPIEAQLSTPARELWMALSIFGSHPFPASYAATLCDLSREDALHALSELLDLYLLARPVAHARNEPDGDSMMCASPHSAAAGRIALGEERESVVARVLARVTSESRRDRQRVGWIAAIPELAALFAGAVA